jgi:hypothetical protein
LALPAKAPDIGWTRIYLGWKQSDRWLRRTENDGRFERPRRLIVNVFAREFPHHVGAGSHVTI